MQNRCLFKLNLFYLFQTHVEATGAMVKEADSALKMLCEEKKGREKERDKDRDRNGLTLKDSASPRIQDSDILSHLSLLNYSTGVMAPSAGDWDNNRGRDGGGFDNMNLSTGRDGDAGPGRDELLRRVERRGSTLGTMDTVARQPPTACS